MALFGILSPIDIYHLFFKSSYTLLFLTAVFNAPLVYHIYTHQFDFQIFAYSYLGCGILQGVINHYLYKVSDTFFFGKPIDMNLWKANPFYEIATFNAQISYANSIGYNVYNSLTIFPTPIKWTLEYPGLWPIAKQLTVIILLHDFFFATTHIILHKIPRLRIPHIALHHNCPFHIGSSRCAIAGDSPEVFIRDLYSLFVSCYLSYYFTGSPFYAYLWIPYYSAYSFWAMYIHTGVNAYHRLHHGTRPNRNYGLYYITDYLIGTLDLKEVSEST